MAITDIFSKRQQKLRGEMPDVYIYDKIPQHLRMQIAHIWNDILEEDVERNLEFEDYLKIHNILCREYGVYQLRKDTDARNDLLSFFFEEENAERILDIIELAFIAIDNKKLRDYDNKYDHYDYDNVIKIIDESIEELNSRFKEHGIGYQYENGQIIRIDSQLIHDKVVRPALQLLSDKHYAGAEQEFLKAHEHYRNGNSKEALNECLKSFESVMKAICQKREWTYNNNATSKILIQICLKNGLIPQFWQKHYSSLEDLLKHSVPTARNKLSGHGQGSDIETVPDYLVAYMLHMTASAIVFLVEAEKNL